MSISPNNGNTIELGIRADFDRFRIADPNFDGAEYAVTFEAPNGGIIETVNPNGPGVFGIPDEVRDFDAYTIAIERVPQSPISGLRNTLMNPTLMQPIDRIPHPSSLL